MKSKPNRKTPSAARRKKRSSAIGRIAGAGVLGVGTVGVSDAPPPPRQHANRI